MKWGQGKWGQSTSQGMFLSLTKKVYYEDCIQPEFYIIVKWALWKGKIACISFSAEHNHYLSLFQGF